MRIFLLKCTRAHSSHDISNYIISGIAGTYFTFYATRRYTTRAPLRLIIYCRVRYDVCKVRKRRVRCLWSRTTMMTRYTGEARTHIPGIIIYRWVCLIYSAYAAVQFKVRIGRRSLMIMLQSWGTPGPFARLDHPPIR